MADADEVDALFQLPLPEFTAARNALAAKLKKAGRSDQAELVKKLAKPSVSAWAVNQLYWKHRAAFDRLLAAGEQFTRAHATQLAGKRADTHGLLAARREALNALLQHADALLRAAGHSPTPDIIHRITTTLETLSTSSTASGTSLGRLSSDVAVTGFELLASLVPVDATPDKRSLDESRLEHAKAMLQQAEMALREKRAAAAEVEARLKSAAAAAEQAQQRLERVKAEAGAAAKAVEEAEGAVEKARFALHPISGGQ